tara:strand:+ start:7350 stop:7703 length:354 start_codon:yes stop_codon:yes gene_type:complete
MIAVGMLDRKVSLWQPAQTQNTDYGGYNKSQYTAAGFMYAHVVWKGGKVSEEGEQMQNNQYCEFYVRNSGMGAQATVRDYIYFDDGQFYIEYINSVDGRGKFLKIVAYQIKPTDIQK